MKKNLSNSNADENDLDNFNHANNFNPVVRPSVVSGQNTSLPHPPVSNDFLMDFSTTPTLNKAVSSPKNVPSNRDNNYQPNFVDLQSPNSYTPLSSRPDNPYGSGNGMNKAPLPQNPSSSPHSHPTPGSSSTPPPQVPPKKKKKKSFFRGLLIFCIILLLLVMGAWYFFGGLTINNITSNPAELGIDPSLLAKNKLSGVTNIALFGVDSRDDTNTGRSDAIMILSIDRKHNQMKLTSILRDSYVAIEGHSSQKITHAYSLGGPLLAIKTINQNFKLDIQDYVTVNFNQLANVINAVGGIDIEITEAERVQINALANSEGQSAPILPNAGMVTLNGTQATAYSRIRKIDSDNARADRQKKVLDAMLFKTKNISPLKYPNLAKSIFPLTETSMNYIQMMSLSPAVMFGSGSFIQNTLPNEADNPIGGNYDGYWVWRFDIPAATTRLHQFIYQKAAE